MHNSPTAHEGDIIHSEDVSTHGGADTIAPRRFTRASTKRSTDASRQQQQVNTSTECSTDASGYQPPLKRTAYSHPKPIVIVRGPQQRMYGTSILLAGGKYKCPVPGCKQRPHINEEIASRHLNEVHDMYECYYHPKPITLEDGDVRCRYTDCSHTKPLLRKSVIEHYVREHRLGEPKRNLNQKHSRPIKMSYGKYRFGYIPCLH